MSGQQAQGDGDQVSQHTLGSSQEIWGRGRLWRQEDVLRVRSMPLQSCCQASMCLRRWACQRKPAAAFSPPPNHLRHLPCLL